MRGPLPALAGEVVDRDGFVFADLVSLYPERIVCLTEKRQERQLLGEGHRVDRDLPATVSSTGNPGEAQSVGVHFGEVQ